MKEKFELPEIVTISEEEMLEVQGNDCCLFSTKTTF